MCIYRARFPSAFHDSPIPFTSPIRCTGNPHYPVQGPAAAAAVSVSNLIRAGAAVRARKGGIGKEPGWNGEQKLPQATKWARRQPDGSTLLHFRLSPGDGTNSSETNIWHCAHGQRHAIYSMLYPVRPIQFHTSELPGLELYRVCEFSLYL